MRRPTEVMAAVEEAISETAISETAVSETAVSETATFRASEQTAAVTADFTKADQQLDRSKSSWLTPMPNPGQCWSRFQAQSQRCRPIKSRPLLETHASVVSLRC